MCYHRYDTSTGTFTADKAGLYHFEVHLLFEEAKAGYVYIRKNDVVHCTQWGQGGSNGEELHTACTAIVELEVLKSPNCISLNTGRIRKEDNS